ncbi:hypothetical protein HanRHA438_Chr12g0537111 [Helianthus annuus]|uniref:Uncharacterized protein n=1 Tax=Helianthus annuus TaxID=4232 RepID=A0A9K3EP05_HELAN|nr:hypothetical protein HanXRQr2_Chr12g0525591 [Helianthus annuus]KAJ0488239.1 putative transcription factor IBH1 [Helianthus annuus]KAJ0504073.1 putative transcription factor IBH1 [Helianthus annuus]KAJ0677129.1 putative transcription factor IBH1 [Helianthus annuus]KAJ0861414.1 hypothetical protein HanPSC8_Chr12g0506371 [Helianthus annuus]
MGIWRRGVVVGRTCGRKRVKKMIMSTENRHGRSIERKLRRLQNMIPGSAGAAGQVVDTDALFQRIAVYICLLESRVKLLQNVYALFGPHD